MNINEEIPKKIHFCWFGDKEKPKDVNRCIESWKLNLPNYEIIEWNELNFDINSNEYTKQAYEAKKYAFVTDYVRLYVLHNYGGVYMDTDVEVLKDISEFLHHGAFSGFQSINEIPTGLMAAKCGNRWIEELLKEYNNKKFIKEDGSLDVTANVSLITEVSLKQGLKLNNEFQMFSDDVAMYPIEYFCAKDYKTGKINKTNNTFSIHHFSGSWLSSQEKLKVKIRYGFGSKNYEFIKSLIYKK